jgi:hypothetical protein
MSEKQFKPFVGEPKTKSLKNRHDYDSYVAFAKKNKGKWCCVCERDRSYTVELTAIKKRGAETRQSKEDGVHRLWVKWEK